MAQQTLMSLAAACISLPAAPTHFIEADNKVLSIERFFEGDAHIVCVEGPDGIGKTTLLAAFTRAHPECTISHFLQVASRPALEHDYIRNDLFNQVSWLLHKEELTPSADVDRRYLSMHTGQLQRYAKNQRGPLYFVIDGLGDLPSTSRHLIDFLLVDTLPIGLEHFRFLLAIDKDMLPTDLLERTKVKEFPLTGFSLDETRRYFDGFGFEHRQLADVHRHAKGNPGILESIRRILISGVSIPDFIDSMSEKLPKLFDMEWKAVNEKDNQECLVLAIIAYKLLILDQHSLAVITGTTESYLTELCARLKFLSIDDRTNVIQFVSEPFRKYAASRLSGWNETATQLIITQLLANPKGPLTLRYLPTLLQESGNLNQLIDFLGPETVQAMVNVTGGIAPALRQLALGVEAAAQVEREADMVRLCLTRSALNDLDIADALESEVRARVLFGDAEYALQLALGATLSESRLNALAIIGRIQQEKHNPLEPALVELIKYWYRKTDFTGLDSDRVIEIACNLLYTVPELAIELVESAKSDETGRSSIDWALARFSLDARVAVSHGIAEPQVADTARARIVDADARRFSSAVSLFLADYSAPQLLAQVESLQDIEERVFLLTRWASANPDAEGNREVIEYALDTISRATNYGVNATVLRRIATPLVHVDNQAARSSLLARFDGIRGTAERNGPAEEYVRLQLVLAEVESTLSLDKAGERISDIYLYVLEMKGDSATKAASMARIVEALDKIDPGGQLDELHGLNALATLDDMITRVLSDGAEHLYGVRNVLRALSCTRSDYCLALAHKLNTRVRRDSARLEIVDSLLRTPDHLLDLAKVDSAITQIQGVGAGTQARSMLRRRLASAETLTEEVQRVLAGFKPLSDFPTDMEDRCEDIALAVQTAGKLDSAISRASVEKLLADLRESWYLVDSAWRRFSIGYEIAAQLTTVNRQEAQEYIKAAHEVRESTGISTADAATDLSACLHLAAMALAALMKSGLSDTDSIDQFDDVVARMPSQVRRCSVWACLASRLYADGSRENALRIYKNKIEPILDALQVTDLASWYSALAYAIPCLYPMEPIYATNLVNQLPEEQRDIVTSETALLVLGELALREPSASAKSGAFDVTFDKVLSVCHLLDSAVSDMTLYNLIELLAGAIASPSNRNKLTSTQRKIITDRLTSIVDKLLPRKGFIEHAGYSLICRAQILRISRDSIQSWLDLVAAAHQVPNTADRALVLAYLAQFMPDNQTDHRRATIELARREVEAITVTLDRIDRYEPLAKAAWDIDNRMAQDMLQSAIRDANGSNQAQVKKCQSDLIDLAHKFSDDLAASLASLLDDDQARLKALDRRDVKKRLDAVKKKLVEDRNRVRLESNEASDIELMKIAWELFGELNSGRLSTSTARAALANFSASASRLSVATAYPFYALWIASLRSLPRLASDQVKILRTIYSSLLQVSSLIEAVGSGNSRAAQWRESAHKRGTSASLLFRPDELRSAQATIKDWLAQHLSTFLVVADPYFGPEELWLVRSAHAVGPECEVTVLTSKHHHQSARVKIPLESAYLEQWKTLSVELPPPTRIVIADLEPNGTSPVHDRWLLTDRAGLRIGTSFNTLGRTKISEVSPMSEDDANRCLGELEPYTSCTARHVRDSRLRYVVITL